MMQPALDKQATPDDLLLAAELAPANPMGPLDCDTDASPTHFPSLASHFQMFGNEGSFSRWIHDMTG